MQIPTWHGRQMKLIKKYTNHVLFEDEQTGIRLSFNYYELGIKHTNQIEEAELKQYKKMGRKNKYIKTRDNSCIETTA